MMVRTIACLMMLLALVALSPATAQESKEETSVPVVEIAILLDTSGSMDGLINQARTHLWSIVNTLATTEKNGQIPTLRVALYEYGKQSQPAENGFIRQCVPLSTDLDTVSQELFALNTDGGDEFCGHVIQKAVNQLGWTPGDHYKAIFIAGNEPFTQGKVNYEEACSLAISKGIIVNTIHCGSEAEGRQGKWDHGASLADGKFMNINQDKEEVAIAAPQDKKLAELNAKLNKTYLGYGRRAQEKLENQKKQDEHAAAAAPSAAAKRAETKSRGAYNNKDWDLVDAMDEAEFELGDVEEEQLPEEMKGMSDEEKEAYVAKKKAEREAIQAEIQALAKERDAFITEERKKLAEDGEDTFEGAVKKSLAEQLETKGYEMGK
jgi:hypothetical protein